jgi:seryl-tRNA(Sec) selenium transferase
MHVHGNSATDWKGLAAITRAVGVERTVLVTDLGRADYALDPVQGMNDFLQRFAELGFSRAEIDLMARRTPARLLELEPW